VWTRDPRKKMFIERFRKGRDLRTAGQRETRCGLSNLSVLPFSE
jgi:hypothetical protein